MHWPRSAKSLFSGCTEVGIAWRFALKQALCFERPPWLCGDSTKRNADVLKCPTLNVRHDRCRGQSEFVRGTIAALQVTRPRATRKLRNRDIGYEVAGEKYVFKVWRK